MKTIFMIFCLFLSAPVWSQTVSVEVLVTTNRMLSRLDELEELANTSQLVIRLRNSTPFRQNVQLEMRLTSLQTQFSIHTNRNAAPSFFPVNAFDTRTLNVSDLNELFDQNSFELGDGRTLAEFLAADPTGQVPSGQYRLCVRVVPQSLTPPQPTSYQSEGCTNITFQQFNPPVISLINNYPYSEGAAVPPLRNPNAPFPITFTPPISLITNPVNVLFKYTLVIAELFENDQRDPNQVLRAVIDGKEPRGIVVRKEILNSPAGQAQITVNLLPVDFSAPFQLAQNYAVAVLAELQGATTAELPNGGLSPICQFQYGRRTVVNRPLTGRKGLDEFIGILNNLDAPDKSTQELLDQALAELGRHTVVMKANKICYSLKNRLGCIKLDSVYDAVYPDRGTSNLMKLLTDDYIRDTGIEGDAISFCGKGMNGDVSASIQQVGGLTTGISAFLQKPSDQSINDRMKNSCGQTAGAGGRNMDGSGECTDCSIDPDLAKVIATGSVDQLDPIVQSINKMFEGCSPSGDNDIEQIKKNSGIANVAGNTGSSDEEKKDRGVEAAKTMFNATKGLVKTGIDANAVPITSPAGMITAGLKVGLGVATFTGEAAGLGNNESSRNLKKGLDLAGNATLMVLEFVGAATVGASGATIATIGYLGWELGSKLNDSYLSEPIDNAIQKYADEKWNKENGVKLTTGDVSKNFQERQEKAYDLKKRFGRLGWGDVFGGGGGGSSNPTGTGPKSGGNISPTGDVTGFACRMVAKCNQDGWGTQQCRGFMASFNCAKGVDNRMVYTDPDAFSDGRGCGAPPNKNKYGCTEKMIGQSNPNNLNDPCAKIASNRDILAKILARGRDPRYTDPVDPNSGIDIPTGGGKKVPGLNPQSTNNPQPILGGQRSPTTPINTIPKPVIDKPTVPKPNGTRNNSPGQNPDPNKNRTNR